MKYRAVTATSESSVQARRERSMSRFAKGNPWGIMCLLNDEGQCVHIFGLGRRTGKEGPIRIGHEHIGVTQSSHEQGYDQEFLALLTQRAAPEIRRLGEDQSVAESVRANFVYDINQDQGRTPLRRYQYLHQAPG